METGWSVGVEMDRPKFRGLRWKKHCTLTCTAGAPSLAQGNPTLLSLEPYVCSICDFPDAGPRTISTEITSWRIVCGLLGCSAAWLSTSGSLLPLSGESTWPNCAFPAPTPTLVPPERTRRCTHVLQTCDEWNWTESRGRCEIAGFPEKSTWGDIILLQEGMLNDIKFLTTWTTTKLN